MANVLKLKHGSTELNLLAAANGGLQLRKWYPRLAEVGLGYIPDYLNEEMDVQIDRTSHNLLATSFQELDEMRRKAAKWRADQTLTEPVWLHAKMSNETGERRAYIRRITGDWRSGPMDPAGLPVQSMALVRLNLERHPYWEPLTTTHDGVVSPLSGASVLFDYTSTGGDVKGDTAARIAYFGFSMSSEQTIDRVWCGLRSTKHGTPANFVNIWECEDADATAGTDCGAPTTDATASPGSGNTKRVVSFATQAGWAKRLSIELEDITSNLADQFGLMLWLFRGKCDAATTCEIQLRWGFKDMGDSDFTRGPIQELSNSNWDYLEQGVQQMPPIDIHANLSGVFSFGPVVDETQVQIWARRTAGSGSLHLDCLCPIPLDEGWLIAKQIASNVWEDQFVYCQSPADEEIAFAWDTSITNWPEWSADHFRLPPGDGRMVIVYADETQSILSNDIAPAIDYYPRWSSLRGSE